MRAIYPYRLLTILALWLLCTCPVTAQTYQFPEIFPQFYNGRVDSIFPLLNKKPLKGLNEQQSCNFRMNTLYGMQQHIDENDIYLDWPLVEHYVRSVFDSIVPKEYLEKSPIQLLIARDPKPNASANDNGFLLINIGLLASLRNEAALASTMAHEACHAIGDHEYHRYVDYVSYRNSNPGSRDSSGITQNYYSRNYERVADSFSYARMIRSGYNLEAVTAKFDLYARSQNRAIHRSLTYSTGTNISRAKDLLQARSSHPMSDQRIKAALALASKAKTPGANYLVDSLTFQKIRKLAQEECKKILFEKGDYKKCAERAFVDYLYNETNQRNLYYLVESIRRMLYTAPELAKKGFLAEEYSDPEFVEYNQSILQKPSLLFLDSTEEKELGTHPFFTDDVKPFHTYEEAFFYFCDKAKALNMNEAHFSLALYHYSKKEEALFQSCLSTYIAGGSGIHRELAAVLAEKGHPTAPGKKLLLLYDNSGMYAENTFSYGANYYQLKVKSKLNTAIAPLLKPKRDSLATKLIFLNELTGNKPKELYEYQKLEQTLIALFNKKDKEKFRKKKLSGKEEAEDYALTNKYSKNLFIYAPEYYNWCREQDFGSVCFVNVSYDFNEVLSATETRNDYTLYYFNFNVLRPYFKTGFRNLSNRKQSDTEMAKEIAAFLYEQ